MSNLITRTVKSVNVLKQLCFSSAVLSYPPCQHRPPPTSLFSHAFIFIIVLNMSRSDCETAWVLFGDIFSHLAPANRSTIGAV